MMMQRKERQIDKKERGELFAFLLSLSLFFFASVVLLILSLN